MKWNKKLEAYKSPAVKILATLFLVFGLWLLLVGPTHALEIDVVTSPEVAVTDESIAAYIVRLYWFAVGAAGIVAVAVIVGGGIYYMTSSGNPSKQNEAKSYITSALWGVVLLLGSFFILNTINPEITKLESLDKAFSLPPCDGASGKPGIDCLPAVPRALPLCEGDKVRTGKRLEDGSFETVAAQPGTNCLPACGASERACSLGEKTGETKFGDEPCAQCAYSPYVAPEGIGCDSACFFDPDKPAAEANCFGDAEAVCTAIDKRTAACEPGNLKRPTACVCENCQQIPDYIPIKSSNTCLSSTLGNCFLQESTVKKLERALKRNIGDAKIVEDYFNAAGWRITEAFPPIVDHASTGHYNGKAFDIAPASVEGGCNLALDIAKAFAAENFYTVLIEGPKDSCSPVVPDTNGAIPGVPGVKRYVNNASFHIHIVDY